MYLTLSNLTEFVIKLDRDDIRTAEALLVKVTRDQTVAKMIMRLLYWFPKSVKQGGWVYKSWRDWMAECGISQAQIKRVHKNSILEEFGFVRKLMKANGAPTTHYLVDPKTLTQRIADFLEINITDIQKILTPSDFGNKATKHPQNKQEDRRKTRNEGYSQTKRYFDCLESSVENDNNYDPDAFYDGVFRTISSRTEIPFETLKQLDPVKAHDGWQKLLTEINMNFFNAVAISMNDIVLDALKGMPKIGRAHV